MGIYQTNLYFLYREGAPECIVVDAPDQGKEIVLKLEQHGFKVAALLLTHGHFDHVWGANELRQFASSRGNGTVKIYAAKAEENVLLNPELNVSAAMRRPVTVKANELLADGQEVTIADMKFRCIVTPGHTEGSCCYYFEEAGILCAGDTLFLESVGRTDFPTGSGATLERSAKEKLFVLPEDTKVYPGHGDETTIGHEKKYNPFLVD